MTILIECPKLMAVPKRVAMSLVQDPINNDWVRAMLQKRLDGIQDFLLVDKPPVGRNIFQSEVVTEERRNFLFNRNTLDEEFIDYFIRLRVRFCGSQFNDSGRIWLGRGHVRSSRRHSLMLASFKPTRNSISFPIQFLISPV